MQDPPLCCVKLGQLFQHIVRILSLCIKWGYNPSYRVIVVPWVNEWECTVCHKITSLIKTIIVIISSASATNQWWETKSVIFWNSFMCRRNDDVVINTANNLYQLLIILTNDVFLVMENKWPTFSFSLKVILKVSSIRKYNMLKV